MLWLYSIKPNSRRLWFREGGYFMLFLLLERRRRQNPYLHFQKSVQVSTVQRNRFYLWSLVPDVLFPDRRCLGLRSNTCLSASPFLPWRFMPFWEFFIIFFAFFAIWGTNRDISTSSHHIWLSKPAQNVCQSSILHTDKTQWSEVSLSCLSSKICRLHPETKASN